ncbi:MAG: ATP synthase F0 subunit B [Polyangiaceae bacterium]|nr:ATP synthase F0 subunit B [Polyangiaceae bacterium]
MPIAGVVLVTIALVSSWGGGLALAQPEPSETGDHAAVAAEARAARGTTAHGADEHEVGEPGAAEHHAASGHHEAPGELNWIYGVLGEREDVEPNLLWRRPGMPGPLLALLLDTAVVFGALYYFGRKPLAEALRARRQAILKGIEEATAMKREAAARLAHYQERLEHIDDEVKRLEREMRVAGQAERERVLADARRKREAMERDARTMVALEAKAAAEDLRVVVVRGAVARAREVLASQASGADQRRLVDEYLEALRRSEGRASAPGGAP